MVETNDIYFFAHTVIPSDDMFHHMLEDIEKVKYISPFMFQSLIHPELGNVSKDKLSSGCKTALNVYQNPEVCFLLLECGKNFRDIILTYDRGCIEWISTFQSDVDDNMPCDIIYDNAHFDVIGNFFRRLDELC